MCLGVGSALRVLGIFELQGGRIHAVPDASGCRSIFKDMAQMRLALRANSLHAAHAVARVDDLFDRIFFCRLVKTRPTATGIKFGAGIKKQFAAAHAVVLAILPMLLIASAKGPLGGRVSGDFKGDVFCTFLL